MAPTLYYATPAPPSRAVLMVAKTIGLELNLKEMSLVKGEQYAEWFLKINPQHTLPTFVDDDGFTIWESHAIMTYIVAKYAKDDSLYPKDLKQRALIDQRLHFDTGVAFSNIIKILAPMVYKGKTTVDEEDLDNIAVSYGFLEAFLEGSQWIAGDSVTIADFSLIATVTSLNILLKIDEKKFPRVSAWLKRAESLSAYEVNKKGFEAHAAVINGIWKRN